MTAPVAIKAFIAKLLAPLPDTAKPVLTNAVAAEIRENAKTEYYSAWNFAEIAWHRLAAAQTEGCVTRVLNLEPSWDRTTENEWVAREAFIVAMDRMMRVPAQTKGMLADKRARFKRWPLQRTVHDADRLCAIDADWRQLLDRDAERLAGATGVA